MLTPLLPLSTGHLTLILASGLLDGRILLADGTTVIVKGISSKAEYKKSDKTEVIGGGTTCSAVVTGERPSLKLRVLSSDGRIEEYT